jgi:acetolactate synthase small subunit
MSLCVIALSARRIVTMSSHAARRVDCFSVFSAADPSALPRILEVFSLFGLIPNRCHSTCMETDHRQLVIDVQVAGLPLGQAEQLAKRLSRVITVTQVLCSEKQLAVA